MSVTIRKMTFDDVPEVVTWVQADSHLLQGLTARAGEDPEPLTVGDVLQFLMAALQSPKQHWAVAEAGGEIVGVVGATDPMIVGDRKSASTHIIMNPEHSARSGGLATMPFRVHKAAIEYARDELGLNTLIGFVPRDVPAAKRLNEAAGFRDTGVDVMVLEIEEPAQDPAQDAEPGGEDLGVEALEEEGELEGTEHLEEVLAHGD